LFPRSFPIFGCATPCQRLKHGGEHTNTCAIIAPYPRAVEEYLAASLGGGRVWPGLVRLWVPHSLRKIGLAAWPSSASARQGLSSPPPGQPNVELRKWNRAGASAARPSVAAGGGVSVTSPDMTLKGFSSQEFAGDRATALGVSLVWRSLTCPVFSTTSSEAGC